METDAGTYSNHNIIDDHLAKSVNSVQSDHMAKSIHSEKLADLTTRVNSGQLADFTTRINSGKSVRLSTADTLAHLPSLYDIPDQSGNGHSNDVKIWMVILNLY